MNSIGWRLTLTGSSSINIGPPNYLSHGKALPGSAKRSSLRHRCTKFPMRTVLPDTTSLEQQEHLRINEAACIEPVVVHAARQSGCIKFN
jgi:hypothetical protein